MKDKGMTEDAPITDLVNRTIAEVSKQGGGTVVIPEGKWKSARIVLKSNVNLHLAKGAELEFSGCAEDYLPAVFTRHEGVEIMRGRRLYLRQWGKQHRHYGRRNHLRTTYGC